MLVLLVPERATEFHLQLLANAAQLFGDRRFRDHIRAQTDAGAVLQAFTDWNSSGA
jgi:PTS system nitrogen regulatory IIA component